MPPRAQLNIKITPELLLRLKTLARLEGITATELATRAITSHLEETGDVLPVHEQLQRLDQRVSALEEKLQEP